MIYSWQKPNVLVDLHATAQLNQTAVVAAGTRLKSKAHFLITGDKITLVVV